MALDLNLISIIIFYTAIAIFFILNRKKISIEYFVAILYRTKRGMNTIRKLANKFPRFWKIWGYAAIPVGFAGMGFITVFLAISAIKIILLPSAAPAVSLVIPGVRIPGASIFVPFWYGIISLIIVLVVHEGAHGILSETWKMKLKSVGVGLFAIIPLAFVEPDEKKLAQAPQRAQLAVFAAGPFANICTALIAIILLMFVFTPLAANSVEVTGLAVSSVTPEYPAALAGLVPGEKILAIDDIPIPNGVTYLQSLPPDSSITILTDKQEYSMRTTANPNNASMSYIGIQFNSDPDIAVRKELAQAYGQLPLIWLYLSKLFFWIFTLNFGIGLINLLPLGPIDGGKMVSTAISRAIKNKKLARRIWSIITALSLALLLFNVFGPYLLKLSTA